jgi:hypothetical protein
MQPGAGFFSVMHAPMDRSANTPVQHTRRRHLLTPLTLEASLLSKPLSMGS